MSILDQVKNQSVMAGVAATVLAGLDLNQIADNSIAHARRLYSACSSVEALNISDRVEYDLQILALCERMVRGEASEDEIAQAFREAGFEYSMTQGDDGFKETDLALIFITNSATRPDWTDVQTAVAHGYDQCINDFLSDSVAMNAELAIANDGKALEDLTDTDIDGYISTAAEKVEAEVRTWFNAQ